MRTIRITLLCCLLIALSGCSLFRSAPTLAAKEAVVRVSNEYLGAIILNRRNWVTGMVLWLDYLQNTGLPAKEAMFTKMHRAAERYTEKNHPLMQLDILEVDVDGNDAELALRKKGNREAPVIEIELTWVGSGWLIVNDNIFPDGGVLDRVMRTS